MIRNFFFSNPVGSLGPFSAPNDSFSPFFFLLTQCNTQSVSEFVASYKTVKVLHHSRQQEHKPEISIPLLQATARQSVGVFVPFCFGSGGVFFAPRGSVFALNSFTSAWENHTYCLDYFLLRLSAMVQPLALESCYLHVSRVTTVQRHIAQSRLQLASKKRQQGSQMYKSRR